MQTNYQKALRVDAEFWEKAELKLDLDLLHKIKKEHDSLQITKRGKEAKEDQYEKLYERTSKYFSEPLALVRFDNIKI